ncbi:MAG TPA: transcription elongation factor GreB [Gammaproteobacteria bacterium]
MGRYRPPSPPKSKYITPEGAETLREELDYLWRIKRPRVTQAVAEAAAQGDRSENAEYIYGKKQLGEIDRRVRYLRKRLDGIQIVNAAPADRTRVHFGAWFELEDEAGERRRFRLVGPDEFDRDPNYTSMDSPLGRAVMGKVLDDEIEVQAPGGVTRYSLVTVSYESTAEDTG